MSDKDKSLEIFELGVQERVMLAGLLAVLSGNLATMQVISQFVKDLSLTEEELAAWEVKADGASVQWNPTLAVAKPFSFTPWRLNKIREVLRAVDAKGGVTLQLLPLFGLFLPAAGTEDAELAAEVAGLAEQGA